MLYVLQSETPSPSEKVILQLAYISGQLVETELGFPHGSMMNLIPGFSLPSASGSTIAAWETILIPSPARRIVALPMALSACRTPKWPRAWTSACWCLCIIPEMCIGLCVAATQKLDSKFALPEKFLVVSRSAWSGFAAWFHDNHHISLLMPFCDVTMSLRSLFHRVASINNRFDLPCFDQFFDQK